MTPTPHTPARRCDRAGHAGRAGRAGVLWVLVLLAGCASTPRDETDWPAALPARDYYEQVHALDAARGTVEPREEYLQWVRRFYEGYGAFPFGWSAMSESAIAATPDDRYAVVAAELVYLGQLISAEWAKGNRRRVLSNAAVAAWAQSMNEAIERNEVEALLGRAVVDAEAILAGTLAARAIRVERYFPDFDPEA